MYVLYKNDSIYDSKHFTYYFDELWNEFFVADQNMEPPSTILDTSLEDLKEKGKCSADCI